MCPPKTACTTDKMTPAYCTQKCWELGMYRCALLLLVVLLVALLLLLLPLPLPLVLLLPRWVLVLRSLPLTIRRRYAGVEWGVQCYCGHDINPKTLVVTGAPPCPSPRSRQCCRPRAAIPC